jgi:site-specific recombinase XerD
MKLSVISAEFLTDREYRGCNAATVAYYAKLTRWLCAYLAGQGVIDVEAVTTRHLEGYVSDLRSRPLEQRDGRLSPVTVRKWTLSLKTFWAWIAGRGYVPDNPAHSLRLPKSPQRLPKCLSLDQARTLMQSPMSARDRAAISLMLDAGIRIGECVALDLADVDHSQQTILVRVGKGGKQRMIVFAESTRQALRACLSERRDDNPALFVSNHGSRLTGSGLYKAIKAVADSAGLGDAVSPHKLRHTCATLWLNNGGGLQDISRLLGHSDLATTMIYVSVATETLQDHHRQFSPLEGLQRGRKA